MGGRCWLENPQWEEGQQPSLPGIKLSGIAIAVNGVKPVIDRLFPFEEAKAACQYYQEAQPFGKVIISQS